MTQQTPANATFNRTRTQIKPRFEGCNICAWIGFKHVMYCVEEAVLEHFRAHDMGPRQLYEQKGLCLEIVDSSVRILHALHIDDLVDIEVEPDAKAPPGALRVAVTVTVPREGKPLKAVTGTVDVVFRLDDSVVTAQSAAGDPQLAPYTCSRIVRGQPRNIPDAGLATARQPGAIPPNVRRALAPDNANCFVWQWRVPYFYCHYNDRLQHSGYLRLMEEVLDLFVAERGISIRTLLTKKRWIPVVPQASLQILQEAMMEETLYTVFTVEDIFKDTTYRSRMDCYVERHGELVHTATGVITHGYAAVDGRRDWSLVTFDEEVSSALRAGGRQAAG
jgi:acyl-CoA thioesterase FadM